MWTRHPNSEYICQSWVQARIYTPRKAGLLPSRCLSYWSSRYLQAARCSHADVCRCWTAEFQLKMPRIALNDFSDLNSFFGRKNLTVLQAPEYSTQMHDIKMNRQFAPEIRKRQVHKITVLKKIPAKCVLAKVLSLAQLLPNTVGAGVTQGTVGCGHHDARAVPSRSASHLWRVPAWSKGVKEFNKRAESL